MCVSCVCVCVCVSQSQSQSQCQCQANKLTDGIHNSAFVWEHAAYVEHVENAMTMDADGRKEAVDKYFSSVCYFLKHGSSDTIIANGGVGQMQFQSEGSRLLAMMSLSEAFEFLGDSLQDQPQPFSDLSEHN